MSRIIRQYAEQVQGIALYPVLSLVIFTVFFTLMVVYVRRMGRETLEELSAMPLDDQEMKKDCNA